MKTCSIPGCGKKHVARGWCHTHWMRWRKHGDPLATLLIRDDVEARFLSHVEVLPNGCHQWTAGVTSNGYGGFWLGDKSVRPHRWAYEHWVGPIPEGLGLMHSCDYKLCVNPAHLTPGTQAENLADARAKGRRPSKKVA